MSTSSEMGGSSSSPIPAISPEDVTKAHEERKAQGLDPGFFLQPTRSTNILTGSAEKYEQKRLAALHAQGQYDKLHGGPPPHDDDDDDEKKADGVTGDDPYDDDNLTFEDDIIVSMDVS
jgi:hypothetical protein